MCVNQGFVWYCMKGSLMWKVLIVIGILLMTCREKGKDFVLLRVFYFQSNYSATWNHPLFSQHLTSAMIPVAKSTCSHGKNTSPIEESNNLPLLFQLKPLFPTNCHINSTPEHSFEAMNVAIIRYIIGVTFV